MDQDKGFLDGLVKDGRPLVAVTGLALVVSGGFALFLSATGHFLPHDVQFLGMNPEQLCAVADCRVVKFMFHDRVAFGGALIAIGLLYLWLAEFPLGRGEAWAWWTLLLTGLAGFGSFLSYLGYGYLDTWHGTATLILLPIFFAGLAMSRKVVKEPLHLYSVIEPAVNIVWGSTEGWGRLMLLGTGVGMMLAGGTILVVGMTVVFVHQDLGYMGLTAGDLNSLNPRLVPLIAHDRAGFGGAIFCCGLAVFLCVWCGKPSRSLRQVLALAGLFGFGAAIGVHFVIGYLSFSHLAPAYAGFAMFLIGLGLAKPSRA